MKSVLSAKICFVKNLTRIVKYELWVDKSNVVVVSELTETKDNSQHLIGYLDKVIKPLVLVLPTMSGHAKNF